MPENETIAQKAVDSTDVQTDTGSQSKPEVDTNQAVREFADRALNFLSTASNETLGACLVGLGATTYLILGRVGLVLIGVVSGVALHAAWEGKAEDVHSRAIEERRRKEVGLDVIQRALRWRKDREDLAEDGTQDIYASPERQDFSDFKTDTATALEEMTDAVIRDYVKWWYSPILPAENAFPAAGRRTFVSFVRKLSSQMARKRAADVFLDFSTNSSATMTVFLNEISLAINASPGTPVADAVSAYFDLKPDSNLANLVDAKYQESKLNVIAQDILECYLDPAAYACAPVRVFLQQILAKVVLEMTITSCSRPEFINGWIVHALQDGEPEIMKEIDAAVEGAPGQPTDSSSAPAEVKEGEISVEEKQKLKSDAKDAMDDAMQEAQRLSQMIAEHDAERLKAMGDSDEPQQSVPASSVAAEEAKDIPSGALEASVSSLSLKDDISESTTQGAFTPSSSSQGDEIDEKMERTSSENELSLPVAESPMVQKSFTSFDQLVPESGQIVGSPKPEAQPMTLHNAKIAIFDGSDPNSRQAIKSKPTMEYMIQIEPASSLYSGWMIIRKYADFENLHEVLGRIAKVSGAAVFTQSHPQVPQWKGSTEARLREELERYLMDAVRFKALAESGGMKLFLEKEQAATKTTGQKTGFGWPTPSAFENMGKGMIDALAKAPKEVAGGGKAIFGGVTGVLGKKEKRGSVIGNASPTPASRASLTLSRTSTASSAVPQVVPETPNRNERSSVSSSSARPLSVESPIDTPTSTKAGLAAPEVPSAPAEASGRTIQLESGEIISLPPLPSDTPDDINFATITPSKPRAPQEESAPALPARNLKARSSFASQAEPIAPAEAAATSVPDEKTAESLPPPKPVRPTAKPITTEETKVALELLFATINELYTLSSAWSLRRTLLNAAKTYLLRPNNPQLLSIQQLIQTTALDAMTSDISIAASIRAIRANALPTEDELKAWPAPMSDEEKEKLRVKARKLLCERGMPVALTGVMGMQASSEALGRVFDALQMEKVARGLVFGLMIQALRGLTQ